MKKSCVAFFLRFRAKSTETMVMVRSIQTIHFLAVFSITCSAFTRWVPSSFGHRCFVSAETQASDCLNPDQALGNNLELLDQKQQELVATLLSIKQEHLFQDWPARGIDDDKKLKFISQLQNVDSTYIGGIESYVNKAKKLLESASVGENPFASFTASVPSGEDLLFGDEQYRMMEKLGTEAASKLAFVLVAGGLGERLGFSGIKIALPVELSTETTFLALYAAWILELQTRSRASSGDATLEIPLVIMTSDDTDASTRQLLEEHSYMGLSKSQVTVLKQDKVPALSDNDARLVTKNQFNLVTKPHGHGDVHHLLQRSGVAKQWVDQGKKWAFFFQDTNPLVVNALIPMLGVSVDRHYDMNSLCVPRRAGESAGGIAKLTHSDGHSITINVEYNQLDPLLRATEGFESGDVNDPNTNYSPFPGNVNNILVYLPTYLKTISGPDQGVIEEFVNPKYADAERTKFKKPTRLECMMQDLPKLMTKEVGDEATVGFTTMQRWLTFSPAKNSLAEASAAVSKGAPAGSPASAEAEYYSANREMLKVSGNMKFEDGPLLTFSGTTVQLMPSVVLDRHFALTSSDITSKVHGGSLTSKSSLVLQGSGILELSDIDIDGAVVIKVSGGATVDVKGLVVRNKGWEFVSVDAEDMTVPETIRMRGFKLVKHETMEIVVDQPGHWVVGADGTVTKKA